MTYTILHRSFLTVITLGLCVVFGWWALFHLTFLWKFTALFVPLALAAILFQEDE